MKLCWCLHQAGPSQQGLDSEAQAVHGKALILAQSAPRLYFVTFFRERQGLVLFCSPNLLGITLIGILSLIRISDVAELTTVPGSERLHCDMVPLVTEHKVDGNESEGTPPITALFLQLFVHSLLGRNMSTIGNCFVTFVMVPCQKLWLDERTGRRARTDGRC